MDGLAPLSSHSQYSCSEENLSAVGDTSQYTAVDTSQYTAVDTSQYTVVDTSQFYYTLQQPKKLKA